MSTSLQAEGVQYWASALKVLWISGPLTTPQTSRHNALWFERVAIFDVVIDKTTYAIHIAELT